MSFHKRIVAQNQYTVTPFDAQDQRVRWKSADPSIARVDEDGSVVPLKLGTTKITAILPAGTTKSYTVHVIDKRKDFKSVSVVKSPIYMKVGDYAQVKVKIDAPSAFALVGFSTDDTEIADVDYSTGTLHALSPGRGTVDIAVDYTKKNEWDSKYLECEVIVSDREGVLSTETKATGILGEARNLEEAATDGSGKPVKTGDDSHAGLMLLIAAASLTVLAGIGAARRRKSRQH